MLFLVILTLTGLSLVSEGWIGTVVDNKSNFQKIRAVLYAVTAVICLFFLIKHGNVSLQVQVLVGLVWATSFWRLLDFLLAKWSFRQVIGLVFVTACLGILILNSTIGTNYFQMLFFQGLGDLFGTPTQTLSIAPNAYQAFTA